MEVLKQTGIFQERLEPVLLSESWALKITISRRSWFLSFLPSLGDGEAEGALGPTASHRWKMLAWLFMQRRSQQLVPRRNCSAACDQCFCSRHRTRYALGQHSVPSFCAKPHTHSYAPSSYPPWVSASVLITSPLPPLAQLR